MGKEGAASPGRNQHADQAPADRAVDSAGANRSAHAQPRAGRPHRCLDEGMGLDKANPGWRRRLLAAEKLAMKEAPVFPSPAYTAISPSSNGKKSRHLTPARGNVTRAHRVERRKDSGRIRRPSVQLPPIPLLNPGERLPISRHNAVVGRMALELTGTCIRRPARNKIRTLSVKTSYSNSGNGRVEMPAVARIAPFCIFVTRDQRHHPAGWRQVA